MSEAEDRTQPLLVHAARLGLWEWDIERDVFWANDTAYAMFSFLPGERVDFDRFSQRIHPEERAAVVTAVHDALANHRRYEKEYRIVLPSGETAIINKCEDKWSAGKQKTLSIEAVWRDAIGNAPNKAYVTL